jgi:hypothetical protein
MRYAVGWKNVIKHAAGMQVCKKHGYCFFNVLYLFLINIICRFLHWEVSGGGGGAQESTC